VFAQAFWDRGNPLRLFPGGERKKEPHWGAAVPGGKGGESLLASPYKPVRLQEKCHGCRNVKGAVGANPRVCPGFFRKDGKAKPKMESCQKGRFSREQSRTGSDGLGRNEHLHGGRRQPANRCPKHLLVQRCDFPWCAATECYPWSPGPFHRGHLGTAMGVDLPIREPALAHGRHRNGDNVRSLPRHPSPLRKASFTWKKKQNVW